MVTSISRIQPDPNFLTNQIFIFPKYFNFSAFSKNLEFINLARLLSDYHKNTNDISTCCALSKRTYYFESTRIEHFGAAVTP
jgi:hypothetical protein